MFNHSNCPVYDAKDPVGRSMSGSQIRAISGNRYRVLPGEELKTSEASQARRYRAPRPKPEGLVSGGGDVLPPPGSSNPLFQDFITKLQRNVRQSSGALEQESKQPNEYGACSLILGRKVGLHRFCFGLCFSDFPLHQIADRDHARQLSARQNGQMANPAVRHQLERLIHLGA